MENASGKMYEITEGRTAEKMGNLNKEARRREGYVR
jgi:hypothetical protein